MESQIRKHQESFLLLAEIPSIKKILDLGVCFKPDTDSSKSIRSYKSLLPSIQIKSCFRNSLLASLMFPDLDYYEGWYITENIPIPFEHAFNIKDGSVIDFTSHKFKIPVVEYYGVVIPKEILEEYVNTEQYLTPLQYYFQQISKKV